MFKSTVKSIGALNPARYRPITLIAWASLISVFVFGILSKVNDANPYMAGLYATLGAVMVFITFATSLLAGREQ